MKWSLNKLSVVVGFLSIVVVYQSVFILTSFLRRDRELAARLSQQMPQEVVDEIESEAYEQAEEFGDEFLGEGKARLYLERIDCVECGGEAFDIWVEASELIRFVEVELAVPDVVEVVDQVPEVDGEQVAFGEADVYVKNMVVDGVIQLSVLFEEGFVGKMRLGRVVYEKSVGGEVEFGFSYDENLLSGSYVSDFETGKNVLVEPGGYRF
jgi:hypothetical protein